MRELNPSPAGGCRASLLCGTHGFASGGGGEIIPPLPAHMGRFGFLARNGPRVQGIPLAPLHAPAHCLAQLLSTPAPPVPCWSWLPLRPWEPGGALPVNVG